MSPRGSGSDLHVTDARGPAALPSPPALRPTRSRWRDPRLAVGVAVVALCAVLGARLVGAADDTVGVWVARDALTKGQPVSTADLAPRQVHFEDQTDADRYVSAAGDLPDRTTLDRPVGAGELLPRAALRPAGPGSLTEVPVSVAADGVPSTVRVGSTVDVWVTPDRTGKELDASGSRAVRSRMVLADVSVISAPRSSTSLGPTSTRQVVVGVDATQRARLPASIAALAGGDVVLTVQR